MVKIMTMFLAGLLVALPACGKKKEAAVGKQGLSLKGQIELSSSLAGKTQPSDVLYVMAKPAGGGMTVAAKRLTGNQYPMAFELTSQDLMMPESSLPDSPLNLTVRVDKDGDAMTKIPGDLIGSCDKNPVPHQADGLRINISEVLK